MPKKCVSRLELSWPSPHVESFPGVKRKRSQLALIMEQFFNALPKTLQEAHKIQAILWNNDLDQFQNFVYPEKDFGTP